MRLSVFLSLRGQELGGCFGWVHRSDTKRISRWQLSIYMIRQENFQASKCLGFLTAGLWREVGVELDCVSWDGDAPACSLCYFVFATLAMFLSLVRENRVGSVEQPVRNGIGGRCSESCWGFPPGLRGQARIGG